MQHFINIKKSRIPVNGERVYESKGKQNNDEELEDECTTNFTFNTITLWKMRKMDKMLRITK